MRRLRSDRDATHARVGALEGAWPCKCFVCRGCSLLQFLASASFSVSFFLIYILKIAATLKLV